MSEAPPAQFDPYLFLFASIVVPLIVALAANILGPYLAEYWKMRKERENTKWKQMHERFFTMLTNLPGFYAATGDLNRQKQFLEAYFHVFLYAPDDIIKRLNETLVAMGGKRESATPADRAMKETILAMRRTLYGDTKLEYDDVLFPVPAKML